MNRVRIEKAQVVIPERMIAFSRVEGPLVLAVDWEKRELRVHADEFHEAYPDEALLLFEKFLQYKPKQYFVRIDGDLHRIPRIDVDCSDVAKAGGCEACCSCDSEKLSPPEACSTSSCESNNCLC